jgi:hypothetical protein
MFPLDVNRAGDIPHHLTGIAVVHLLEGSLLIPRRGKADRVVENPLGSIPQKVMVAIAG